MSGVAPARAAAASALPAHTGELFVGGTWVAAEGGRTSAVDNPATGGFLADVADASVADGIAAVDAAVAASEGWAATPARDRAELLRRAFDLLTERRERFATLITLEMGKPLAEARAEVTYAAEFLRWFAEEAPRISGRYGPNPEGTGTVVVGHRPVGPCLLITPWNFPLAMATRKIGPALAAGCTVVIKPAEQTPLTTLLFAELLVEVGLPAGVVNVVTTGSAAAVCAQIMADPRLRKVSFTGSTQVGRILIAQAAQNVLRTSMELGGNAPFLVFDDADLDAAVDGAMQAKFRNIGQACIAANRFLVHRAVAGEFTERVVERVGAMIMGDGLTDGVTIGPLIDDRACARVHRLVTDAVDRGAEVLLGGHEVSGPGSFYEPTVLGEVPAGSAVLSEEIFGPVLAVVPFDTEDEAVALANDTEFGLASYAFTTDLSRAHRLIDRLETGLTGINTGAVSNAAAPFGGIKQSGFGREGGIEGIHEYLSVKYSLISR
ncbi:NAD-dependent succinate-semialdehyde dehydrogenase [Nocardia anaemiae]|uniref:NAD-dependent succinate-semialdehyde dehydrogenase n=1 Tax=Nocardia anaemiae TaxID=263910 RepID=UPI0009FCC00C|nr:NAD-dependent succinate-semialdehyde dehydrogenase [Nocardia anaemiae]